MVDHKAKLDLGGRKVDVVLGSVWESRMRVDQIKSGVKVFSGDETQTPQQNFDNSGSGNDGAIQMYKRVRPKQGLNGISGKSKTLKTDTFQGSELSKKMEEECKELSVSVDDGVEKSPVQIPRNVEGECKQLSVSADSADVTKKSPAQISRQRSELSKNMDGRCKELSASVDGIKRSPVKELSASVDGIKRSPVHAGRKRSEWSKSSDEQCKELSVSANGIKKSPSQIKKTRSELSVDGVERSPIRNVRTRSMSEKSSKETGDIIERNSTQLRKVKSTSSKGYEGNESNGGLRKTRSETNKALDKPGNASEGNLSQLIEVEPVSNKVADESSLNLIADTIRRMSVESEKAESESNELVDEFAEGIKKSPTRITESISDENCKEINECEEKTITCNRVNVSQIKSPPELEVTDDEESWDEELEEEADEEIEPDSEKESFDVKEISIPEQKAKKTVIEDKRIHQSSVQPVPISTKVIKKEPSPVMNNHRVVPRPTKTKPIPVADEYYSVPNKHSKLQRLVDLFMWRDASKSALIFGIGMFIIISSSYTTDLNISLITVLSYLGLIYLAAIFVFRSIIYRVAVDEDEANQEHIIGVEESVWLLELILPYINEFLVKLRALFSGDPATTMKLAVLLFVLARCGSSITIWKMAKLGFFGVFTVPRIFTSYSSQLTALGKFWIERCKDAWESCGHKKAVGFFIFTLVWNLSSVAARIWGVFMVFVAFKYYQQYYCLTKEGDVEEAEEVGGRSTSVVGKKDNNSSQQRIIVGGGGGPISRRQIRGPTLLETKKLTRPS